jgi:hypothetical protein
MKRLKKTGLFMLLIISILSVSYCTSNTAQNQSQDSDSTELDQIQDETGKIPFDFPQAKLQAEIGDYVLVPSYKMWQTNIEDENPSKKTYIFYAYTLSKIGKYESTVKFTFDGEQLMPNSVIIPIPQEQTAKKGDIVLTWWQTGSGMQRAIVVDDANPKKPKVMYLDLDYDNPAKDNESGKTIGQTVYALKENSFVKLNETWTSGNMIAVKEGKEWVSSQIINIADDKILCLGFAGKMSVYSKSDCVLIPLYPEVNEGDVVMADFAGKFKEFTVTKVDEKIGRVFVEQFGKIKAIPFGKIIKEL